MYDIGHRLVKADVLYIAEDIEEDMVEISKNL